MGNIPILSREKVEPTYVEAHSLKRKLKNGDWVYISEGNQLLILSDEVVRQLNSLELIDEESFLELVESGILVERSSSIDDKIKLSQEPKGGLFKALSLLIIICGIVAFFISVIEVFTKGFPFESAVNILFANPLKFFLIAIPISIVSTVFHEFMHIIFSGSSNKININITKAVATVPMTHVWTWSKLGRITAIVSGMSLDIIFLAVFLVAFGSGSGLASIGASILITRLIWQFIITKKTDINILTSFLADNPFYFEDIGQGVSFIVEIVSLSSLIMMLLLWIIPIFNQFN
ncbi:hypothetical protein [Vagococcus carniphilus]|uniref:Uncharacterized protein n=1 Tax=Vagococcus carniphilus TaxID=218144 RepID=A0A430B699_9ENTE|nr:hypothetical protein [Vagococcus carniphilus]QNN72701.1 hypothetical protein H9L18_12685 [Vagococcus carniphilus]RSU15807.1 hypothetical protein CBF28_05060 [Vagococcus carniphilus]